MSKITFKEIKRGFRNYISLFRLLIADSRIPFISKALLGFCIGYFFMPFDLIPDFIPVLGQLDDLIIIPSLAFVAVRLIPKDVYEENYRKAFHGR